MSYYEYPRSSHFVWEDEEETLLKFIKRQKVRSGGLDDYFKKLEKKAKSDIKKKEGKYTTSIKVTDKRAPYVGRSTELATGDTTQKYCIYCAFPSPSHKHWCTRNTNTKENKSVKNHCKDCGEKLPNHSFACPRDRSRCETCGLLDRHEPWCKKNEISQELGFFCPECGKTQNEHSNFCIIGKEKKKADYSFIASGFCNECKAAAGTLHASWCEARSIASTVCVDCGAKPKDIHSKWCTRPDLDKPEKDTGKWCWCCDTHLPEHSASCLMAENRKLVKAYCQRCAKFTYITSESAPTMITVVLCEECGFNMVPSMMKDEVCRLCGYYMNHNEKCVRYKKPKTQEATA